MKGIVNPEMITLARDVRGLTQSKLAKVSGIRASTISRLEGGVAEASESDLSSLVNALSFPPDFFGQPGSRYGSETSTLFHRRRRQVRTRDLKRIDGLANLHRIASRQLFRSFEMDDIVEVPSIRIEDFGLVSDIAAAVRETWRMPSGPVHNLIGWLERASCLVFSYEFDTDKIDEVVHWIPPDPPIILVNSSAPADRVRFSLAHALGHLVMHHSEVPYPEMEKEANEFAAAFLTPENEIADELEPVTLQHLLSLKQYWKVSMAMLVYRAKDLRIITETRHRSLFQQLSRLGYRKSEPLPIPRETPRVVKALLDAHKEHLGYDDRELAKLLRLNLADYHEWYYPNKIIDFPTDEIRFAARVGNYAPSVRHN